MPHNNIDDNLLNAIAEIESHRDAKAVGDRTLRYPAYGMFQMRQPAFQDVQQFQPQAATGIAQLSDILGHPDVQHHLAQAYLTILQDRYGMRDLDSLLSAYNAGVGAVKRKKVPTATHDYVERIKALLPP